MTYKERLEELYKMAKDAGDFRAAYEIASELNKTKQKTLPLVQNEPVEVDNSK